jgi:hypothetical protein
VRLDFQPILIPAWSRPRVLCASKSGGEVDDRTLIVTLAELLDAADVGVWRPAGPAYTTGDTGIYYGPIGALTVRGVGLTRYNRQDFVPGDFYAVKTRLVQVRIRGLPDNVADADDLAEAVDAVLQGLSRTAGLNYVERRSGPAPLGTDGNRRSELSLNYSVTLED